MSYFEIFGLDNISHFFGQVSNKSNQAVTHVLEDVANRIAMTARSNIGPRRSINFQGSSGRRGTFPFRRTGVMGRNIQVSKHASLTGGNTIQAVISSNVNYGKYVEFGTSRAPAYPYFYPAVKKETKNLNKNIELTLNKIF